VGTPSKASDCANDVFGGEGGGTCKGGRDGGWLVVGGVEAVRAKAKCPPPALRAPSPAASGFAFGYALTSRTQERDEPGKGAGWTGDSGGQGVSAPLPPLRGTLPRGFARGRGTERGRLPESETTGWARMKCPPPGRWPPSPAASRAGEGWDETRLRESETTGWARMKCPPPGRWPPSPAASGFAFGYALTSRTRERDGTRKAAGKRDSWVGEDEVPPSWPSGTLPRGKSTRERDEPGKGRGGRGRRVGLRRAAPRKLGAAVFLDAGYGRQYRRLV